MSINNLELKLDEAALKIIQQAEPEIVKELLVKRFNQQIQNNWKAFSPNQRFAIRAFLDSIADELRNKRRTL